MRAAPAAPAVRLPKAPHDSLGRMTFDMKAETITITGHGGDEIEAYLAQPSGAGRTAASSSSTTCPGTTGVPREIARRFADEGYIALMPNLYSRDAPGASPDDAAAAARAQGGVPDARLVGDVDGAAQAHKVPGLVQWQDSDDWLLLGRASVVARRGFVAAGRGR